MKPTLAAQLEDAGLEPREAQSKMIECVASALENKAISVCEGGTGVGKTLGYLIPALQHIDEETRLVVATATVNLQEQILQKDLPMAAKIVGKDVNAKIAKGRGRYVCLARLFQFNTESQGELALFGVTGTSKQGEEDQDIVAECRTLFEEEEWDGNRDSLSVPVKQALWSKLTADATTCTNRRCSYFNDCPYFKNKRALTRANVIVTNHDLLLADVAMGSGVLLPPFEKAVYVVDEAHHFPEKALKHFAAQSGVLTSINWLKSFETRLDKWRDYCQLTPERFAAITKDIESAKSTLESIYQAIDIFYSELEEDCYLFEKTPESLSTHMQALHGTADRLAAALSEIYADLTQNQDSKTVEEYDTELAWLGILIQRNHDLVRVCELYAVDDAQPVAKWMMLNLKTGSRKHDYTLHGAWVNATHLLKTYFWDKLKNGAVMCSATLMALGKFDAFCERAGLVGNPKVMTANFPSPFPYAESVLQVPKMKYLPSPQFSQQHAGEIAEQLPTLLKDEQHGSLVLFTSQWMMDFVYDELDKDLQKQILKQGDLSKAELIRQHKEKVDGGEPSIIFGMQSFSEGVDLPGEYCQHVVITKLPFSVPTTPIEKTRQRWLKSKNQNPFAVHTLPEASLRLTQAVGRLLRTPTDRGKVTILDRRLCDKPYGKQILINLPGFQKNIDTN